MQICFHCEGANYCECITCGRDVAGGRILGVCQACIGRDFHFRHRAVMEEFPPEDFENWETVAAADGNKGYRVYKPFVGLK